MPDAVEPESEIPDLPPIDTSDDIAVLKALFAQEIGIDEAPTESEEQEAPEEDSEEEPEEEEEAEPAEEAEEPKEEPVAEAAPAPDPDVAARLERVAATERELSRRRREFDTQRAELARMEEAVKARQAEAARGEAFVKELTEGDPLKALNSLGIDFETLAKGVALGEGVRPNKQLEERQERLERELREYREAEANARAAAHQESLRRAALAEISQMAVEKSPIVSAMGAEGAEMVFGLAKQRAEETGVAPDYDTLFEDANARIVTFVERFKDVPEVRALFGVSETGKQTTKRAAPKTVSNQTATKVAKRKNEDVDLLSLSEEEQFDLLFG